MATGEDELDVSLSSSAGSSLGETVGDKDDWDAVLTAYSHDKQSSKKRDREVEETEDAKKAKTMSASPEGISSCNDSDEAGDKDYGSENDKTPEATKRLESSELNKSIRVKKSKKKKKSRRKSKSKANKHQRVENEQKGKAAKLIEGLSIHLKKHSAPKLSRNTMGIYQNKSFQLAVRHIITKDPIDQSSFCDTSSVDRVLFVWLSSVSAEMFLSQPSAFTNLSKLPSYPFLIMHPGSETFCEDGSDSFLTIKTNVNLDIDLKLRRTKCMLSMEQLKENDYPVMCSCHGSKDPHQVVSNLEAEEGEVESTDVKYWCLSDGLDGSGCTEVTDESPLFAVDCEMVSTVEDSACGDVARVSVVNEQGECVYDTYVKPYTPVTDYRTKYSGITAEILDGVSTTLADVQLKMKRLIPSNAILVGQSLENDFHSLKLFHPYVIDTALLFTNNSKFKPKLRVLAQHLLKATIQASDKGHNPIEDALACMRLVQLKLTKGSTVVMSCSGRVITSNNGSHSVGLLQMLASRDKGCAFIDRHANVLGYSQGNVHSIAAELDFEAIRHGRSVIKSNDVVWLNLHAMQYYLTQPGTALADARLQENMLHQEAVCTHANTSGSILLAASKAGTSKEEIARLQNESRQKAIQCLQQSIHVYRNAYTQEATNIQKVIRQLDAHVYDLIQACPKGTLVFVVCGSSHVDRIPLLFKASKHCPTDQLVQAELKKVVHEAREGLVLAHFVMHDSVK